MPRPRTPAAKAKASGADLVHPGRFKDRKAPKAVPLGEPFPTMTDGQKLAWRQMAGEMPWLTRGDRQVLRLGSLVVARIEAGEDIGVSAMQTLSSILSKLGATPADATKVQHGDDGDEDPADRFFPRPN